MKISVSKLMHHPRNEEIYNLSNIEDLVQSIRDVGLLSLTLPPELPPFWS